MENNRVITSMQDNHIDDVVAVHLAAFHGFTLSILGARFLKEFYKCVLQDTTVIAFVVTVQGNLVGFVTGSDQPNGFFRRLVVG